MQGGFRFLAQEYLMSVVRRRQTITCRLRHLTTWAILMVSGESYIIYVEVKWIPLKAGNVVISFVMLCVGW